MDIGLDQSCSRHRNTFLVHIHRRLLWLLLLVIIGVHKDSMRSNPLLTWSTRLFIDHVILPLVMINALLLARSHLTAAVRAR